MKKVLILKSVLALLFLLISPPLFSAMEGEVTVTGQGVRGETQSSKFEEYRTVPQSVYLESLSLQADHENSNSFIELQGKKLGLNDQNLSLRFGKWGLGQAGIAYDQTPHILSNTGRSLLVHDGSGNLRISDQLQTSLQTSTNNATAVFSDVPFIPLKVQRDTVSGFVSMTPLETLNVKFSAGQEDRYGQKPLGVSFGHGSIVEIAEPVQYKTRNVSAEMEIHQKSFTTAFTYHGSFFTNDIHALTVDNPWRRTASAITASGSSTPDKAGVALPPDNQAHNFSLAGGSNLPFWNSRLNASAAYGWHSQNEIFLPMTVNRNIIDRAKTLGLTLTPPQSSLNGKIKTLAANASLSLRPFKPLIWTGKVRYYNQKNETPVLIIQQYVPYDSALSTSGPTSAFNPTRQRRNLPVGYSKLNAGTDMAVQILSMLKFNLGYEWEKIKREHREVGQTNDHILKASFNFVPKKWMTLHPSYLHANRSLDHYSAEEVAEGTFPLGEGVNALGQLDLLRKYDQAARLRDMAAVKSVLTPFETLSLTADYSYRIDDYKDTDYGREKETNHSYSLDLMYEPWEMLSIFLDYTREKMVTDMRSRYRRAYTITTHNDSSANDWVGKFEDLTDTYGAGINGTIVKKKLDFDTSYTLTRSRGQLLSYNPNVPAPGLGGTASDKANDLASSTVINFPETNTEFHRASFALNWHFFEHLTFKVRYDYEKYMVKDFAFDNITVWQPLWNQSVFLDASQGSYFAHIIGLSLTYKF